MSVFKCPVCKRMHVVNKYDVDFVCPNSLTEDKTFQNLRDEENITKNEWNKDEWRTRVDASRDVHITGLNKLPSDKNVYLGGTKSHEW